MMEAMQQRTVFSCAAWMALIALSGCAGGALGLLPDTRTPADRARELTDLCKEDTGPAGADALSPSVVMSVEPAYVHMNAPAWGDVRLRGASLRMRPTLNMPVGVLQRTLECHQARVALGDAAELDEDPYVLAGSWLEIHVSGTEEGLVAAVYADSIEDARRVVDRARKFAAAGRQVDAASQ
jgi:hypothetical protein